MSERKLTPKAAFESVQVVSLQQVRQKNQLWAFNVLLDLSRGKIPTKERIDMASRILSGKLDLEGDNEKKTK